MGNLTFEIASILYTTIFFLFIYIYIIADPKTSRLSYIFQNTIPHYILQKIESIFGSKVSSKIENAHHYLLYEQNPSLLVLYITLIVGSWSIVFVYGYPMIVQSEYVSSYHTVSATITCVACYVSWYYAYHTKPGYIYAANVNKYDNYEYDEVLFCDNNTCPTSNEKKVVRSKHDTFTSKYVARFDHHR